MAVQRSGTAMHDIPAPLAAATPLGESSKTKYIKASEIDPCCKFRDQVLPF
jgi:hypothetical protein